MHKVVRSLVCCFMGRRSNLENLPSFCGTPHDAAEKKHDILYINVDGYYSKHQGQHIAYVHTSPRRNGWIYLPIYEGCHSGTLTLIFMGGGIIWSIIQNFSEMQGCIFLHDFLLPSHTSRRHFVIFTLKIISKMSETEQFLFN